LRQSSAQRVEPVENALTWKQEVNRRVAEHKGRKAGSEDQPAPVEVQHAQGSRAAEAAARVMARYAKAPSYSEMLAEEARAAVRAAEAVSRAALQAQAAAEHVLAGLEAASSATASESGETRSWDAEFFSASPNEVVAEPVKTPVVERVHRVAPETRKAQPAAAPMVVAQATTASSPRASFAIRWDEDMPVREAEPAEGRALHGQRAHETAVVEQAQQPASDLSGPLHTQGFEVVEAALPIHANLIEFPRELVATRKVRPRRAEGAYAQTYDEQSQLSIFEVDPGTVSSEPETAGAQAEEQTAEWVGPKWSGITLDAEPHEEMAAARRVPIEHEATIAEAVEMQPAPINQRMMAALVDCSLVAGGFLAAAAVASTRMKVFPAIKTLEIESLMALAAISVAYLAFFLILAKGTPGMKYAHLELATFSGEKLSMKQRAGRMAALVLSLMPVGLGVALALFDEQHLCWHDRLSGTYSRKG
jgi:uncharacterized RDD family membrane protein YckC